MFTISGLVIVKEKSPTPVLKWQCFKPSHISRGNRSLGHAETVPGSLCFPTVLQFFLEIGGLLPKITAIACWNDENAAENNMHPYTW